MRNYNLGFISDSDIFNHVKDTVLKYKLSINAREFNSNLIDPIKLTFDAKVYGKNIKDLIEAESLRQIDKSNNNLIGYFHQNLFKYAGKDWSVPKEGFDIINESKHIFVELKNKHNTMNSASSFATYQFMQKKIKETPDAVCMLVEVIAKDSQNIVWSLSHKGLIYSDDRIRRVSIDKFYEIVFGDKQAFYKLCLALPKIISDVMSSLEDHKLQNTVYEELNISSDEDIFKLFSLTFSSYLGFKKD